MRIFLIGYMGSGKTKIGKLMASQMGYTFIDMDQQLEARYGMTVSGIFETFGEAEFRKAERICIENFINTEQVIISTGGGAPCHNDNMALMKSIGKTVYLNVPADELILRLSEPRRKEKRPLLSGLSDSELSDYINKTLNARTAFYEMADIITTGAASPEQVVSDIMNSLYGRTII